MKKTEGKPVKEAGKGNAADARKNQSAFRRALCTIRDVIVESLKAILEMLIKVLWPFAIFAMLFALYERDYEFALPIASALWVVLGLPLVLGLLFYAVGSAGRDE